MGKILLKNIICNDQPCDILIEGNLISKIRPVGEIERDCRLDGLDLSRDTEIADCTGKTAVPGFINMHTHSAMTLMRGMEEDVAFQEWIQNIWNIETKINEEYIYWGSKIAALEMIKTGTTTFNDQYWFIDKGHQAATEMGIRPVLSYVILDQNNPEGVTESEQKENCIRRYEESLQWKDGSVFEIAYHAIYTVSEETILWATEFARKHDLLLHIHLSETRQEVEDCKRLHGGLTPVEYLDSLGLLDERVIAAHTLWLTDHDVQILGDRKVNCVHNINSNTKLASGYQFRYNELKEAGANICLGTDGCASSNNLDMLETMKTSALFQKAWRSDPKALPIPDLVKAATSNGAKALRLNTGVLEEGKLADLLIVNTNSTFFLSPGSFWANFIYSAHSDSIESVIANGRFVMRNRIVEGEQEILDNARRILKTIA